MKSIALMKLFLFVILVVIAGCKKEYNIEPVRQITEKYRTTINSGAAWGTISALHDGSTCLFYQKARLLDSTAEINVSIEIICSINFGKTWSKPILV